MNAFLALCLALSAPAWAQLPEEAETCRSCHSPDGGAPLPRLEAYARSAHKDLACTACHTKAGDMPHPTKMAPPDCASCHEKSDASYKTTVHGLARARGSKKAATCADCHGDHGVLRGMDSGSKASKGNLSHTCGRCHKAEATQYARSVHGKAVDHGVKEAPTCTDCHGEHTLRSPSDPSSSVSSAAVTKTCSSCHASERLIGMFNLPAGQVTSFMNSYHGLASRNGSGLHVANCASCHGFHDVLPSSDPASRVSPANVAKTCGQCHAGAALRLGTGKVHAALSGSGEGSDAARLFRLFYLFAIPMTLGGMLVHNLLDLARKTVTGDLRPMREEEDPMLTGNERVQHAVLGLSFTLLAYSGFALKFPGQWWGAPFEWLGGEEFRRWAHRGSAIAFTALSVYHFLYLTAFRAGRARLMALLPAKRDLTDPIKVLAYNAGAARTRPLMPRFSYIEKAEYWALVWGSGVMLVTGAVLAFDSASLRNLPLWAIEASRVVHFMEAVLATGAILLWHGYWVAFDPEVYPMSWAWLTGKVKLGKGHGHGGHHDKDGGKQ
jgi:cytochrome b subunit of formate dehydrogenase